jgi:hypothetical protein
MFTGCAKLPKQEISAAKAACESALVAQANVFATERFNAAQELMNTALADIKVQQNTKSVFARNYDKTQKTLVDAVAAFDSSKIAATAGKTAIREEAKALLDKVRVSAGESEKQALLLIKKRNQDAAALKTKLETATAVLLSDLGAVPDSALITARDSIKYTLAVVDSVKSSLEQLAMAKVGMMGGHKTISKVEKTDKAAKTNKTLKPAGRLFSKKK